MSVFLHSRLFCFVCLLRENASLPYEQVLHCRFREWHYAVTGVFISSSTFLFLLPSFHPSSFLSIDFLHSSSPRVCTVYLGVSLIKSQQSKNVCLKMYITHVNACIIHHMLHKHTGRLFLLRLQEVLWQIGTTSENKCDTTGTRFYSHFKLNVYKKLLMVAGGGGEQNNGIIDIEREFSCIVGSSRYCSLDMKKNDQLMSNIDQQCPVLTCTETNCNNGDLLSLKHFRVAVLMQAQWNFPLEDHFCWLLIKPPLQMFKKFKF